MKIIEGKEESLSIIKEKVCGNDDEYLQYLQCTVSYAERWANLMECKIEQGYILADIAKDTSHEANTKNITGNMYGMAVVLLVDHWVHGEELRKWHNKEWGNPDCDGVVDPAVVTVST